jgi:hypothetical protein
MGILYSTQENNRTSSDSAIKAVSSAYKIRKSFMYICIDSSQRFVMLHNGSTLFSSKEDSKLFLILYADDTALMAESSDGLQKTLNCFEKHCDL